MRQPWFLREDTYPEFSGLVWLALECMLILIFLFCLWKHKSRIVTLFFATLAILFLFLGKSALSLWWTILLAAGTSTLSRSDDAVCSLIHHWYEPYDVYWISENEFGRIDECRQINPLTYAEELICPPGYLYIMNYCNPQIGDFGLKLLKQVKVMVRGRGFYNKLFYPEDWSVLAVSTSANKSLENNENNEKNDKKKIHEELDIQVLQALEIGSLLVMPERDSSRHVKGTWKLEEFHQGIFKIAYRYHIPIIPMIWSHPCLDWLGRVQSKRFAFWKGPVFSIENINNSTSSSEQSIPTHPLSSLEEEYIRLQSQQIWEWMHLRLDLLHSWCQI